jgi:DNA-directed RNA polymerase specialized sigma24 family protein
MVLATEDDKGFEEFFERVEPLLRHALVATYGVERGREAAAEALAYAWQHWAKVQRAANPVGLLYRVGQSKSRPRRSRIDFVRRENTDHPYEPGLASALAALSEPQRVAVVLVHAYGWTLSEVAERTGTKKATIQVHLRRGLSKLRSALEVEEHA